MRRLTVFLSTIALLVPGARVSAAQSPDSLTGAYFRFGGNLTVAAADHEAFGLVVNGTAQVQGIVKTLVVINGTARLDGGRVQELVVVRGRVELVNGAEIAGPVHLIDATLDQDQGSRVLGQIDRGVTTEIVHGLAVVAALAALGLAIAIVLVALLAAAIAPVALRTAGTALATEPGPTVLAAVVVWVGLPLLAALLATTVIGIPAAIALIGFLLPALGLIGFVVSGTRLGDALTRRARGSREDGRPFLSAAAGVGVLLLAAQLPVVGGFVGCLAGVLGGGAVALLLWRSMRHGGTLQGASAEPAAPHQHA